MIRPYTALLVVVVIATLIDVAAGWLLGLPSLGFGSRIAIALLPVPANLVLIVEILKTIRELDEFLKRIHLEAIAIGFLLTGLAVFIYGYLQRARAVRPLNVGIVWGFMILSYGIGYIVSLKRYR